MAKFVLENQDNDIDDEELDLDISIEDGDGDNDTDDNIDNQNLDGEEEKLIPQGKVNKIVQDRLSRQEKKLRAEYDQKLIEATDIGEVVDNLREYGYKGTPKEIAASIKSQIKELKKQEALDNGLSEEEYEHKDKLEELQKEVAKLKQKNTDAQKQQEQYTKEVAEFKKQTKELETAYKADGITVDKLRQDAKFVRFNKFADPKLSLKEVYEAYIDIHGEAEATAISKIRSNMDRSTDSGRNKSGGDSTHGLTKDEIELVDDHNSRYPNNKMTYKEFNQSKHKK